jgi:hypothetical protein
MGKSIELQSLWFDRAVNEYIALSGGAEMSAKAHGKAPRKVNEAVTHVSKALLDKGEKLKRLDPFRSGLQDKFYVACEGLEDPTLTVAISRGLIAVLQSNDKDVPEWLEKTAS